MDTSDRVQLSCRRCGKLRSFLSSAIAPDTFLREVPLAVVVSSSAWWLQTRIYLVRIPRRKGHSIHCDVRSARAVRESPHLRLHSSWPKREGSRSAVTDRIEQRWLNLGCGNVSLLDRLLSSSRLRRPVIRRGSPRRSEWLRRMTGRKKPVDQVSVSLQVFIEALLFRFPRGSFLLIHRELTTLAICLALAQHMPDDCGQFSHHGNTSDRRSSSAFDPFEPLA